MLGGSPLQDDRVSNEHVVLSQMEERPLWAVFGNQALFPPQGAIRAARMSGLL